MFDKEKFINKIAAVDIKRYEMCVDDMGAIYEDANGDLFRVMVLAYKYGFLRGGRAEKKRRRELA